ncbi:unnamed protein product, partial [Ixodes pacificus]
PITWRSSWLSSTCHIESLRASHDGPPHTCHGNSCIDCNVPCCTGHKDVGTRYAAGCLCHKRSLCSGHNGTSDTGHEDPLRAGHNFLLGRCCSLPHLIFLYGLSKNGVFSAIGDCQCSSPLP